MQEKFISKKHRKPSWTLPLMIEAISLILFIAGISLFDVSKNISMGAIVFLGFSGLIFLLCSLESFRLLVGESKENRLIKGKIKGVKTTANFLYSKFKSETQVRTGSTNTLRQLNTYYQIKYSYVDENGISRTKMSYKVYSPKEIIYLKSLGSFDILVRGKNAVIIEDLDDSTINNFNNNDNEKNYEKQNKINTFVVSQDSKKTLPPFANNSTLIVSAICSALFCFAIIGLGIYWICNKELMGGIFAILFAFIPLYCLYNFVLPKIICDKKGMNNKAVLVNVITKPIVSRETTHYYAIINYQGKEHKINIFNAEWSIILKDYINKEIPIKIIKNYISIDYKSLYSDKL